MKRNMKTLFIIFLIIFGLNIFSCQEDVDLDNENIELEEENDNPYRVSSPKSRSIDDDEEFDDPNLLRNQGNKNRKNPMPTRPYSTENIPSQNYIPTPEHIDDKRFSFALYEIVMVIFLIAFLLNCYWGKTTNETTAQRWYMNNRDFVEENYAHVGMNTEYNTKGGVPMLKESYNSFKFYASGRIFMKWMLVNMDFKKRQDLVSLATSLFLFNEKDRIIYEGSLIPSNELPLVFSICKKKDLKTMKKSYQDINFFTRPYKANIVSDNLIFLTENEEIFDQLFANKEFCNLYQRIESSIDIIYLTDRQTYSKENHAIFFSFDVNISRKDLDQHFRDLTQFVHLFVDLLCTAKITVSSKREAEKMRGEFDKVRAKELNEKNAEEAKQRKTEKLTQKYSKSLTIEQAQKLEEKEKKEQLKLQKKKQMKVVKK